LPELQKELTQNCSNYNDSSSESCQDRSFSEVYLLLWTQSLVRLSRHTHTHRNRMSQLKQGEIILQFDITDCLSVYPVPLTNRDNV